MSESFTAHAIQSDPDTIMLQVNGTISYLPWSDAQSLRDDLNLALEFKATALKLSESDIGKDDA